MVAPPSKGPSISPVSAPTRGAHLRLSVFPASRQLTALSCETEFPSLMFRMCTIYLVAYRGFIGIRPMMALIKGRGVLQRRKADAATSRRIAQRLSRTGHDDDENRLSD